MLGNSQFLASAIAAIVSVLGCAAVAQPTVVWDGKPVLRISGGSDDQQPGGVGERGDGSTATSCQENENNSANANIICVFSDLTGIGLGEFPTDASVVVAERFTVDSNGEITGVTWWGFMVARQGENSVFDCTTDVAPVVNDDWRIRYYVDDGDGLPDVNNIIAEFVVTGETPGYTRIDTGENPFGIVSKMEIHYDFPTPVEIECGTLYHVEIYSNYTLNDCFYCWQSAPPGDLQSLQTDFDPETEDFPDYSDPDDLGDFDVAQCQAFSSFGPGANAPKVSLEIAELPDAETGCCRVRFNVKSGRCLGAGEISEFYVAFAKGDAPEGCEDLLDLTPPDGWNVEFCEEWSNDGRAIFRFTGGSLGELATTFGTIKTRVNGAEPVVLDSENTVPAFGIRAWATEEVVDGATACGTGSVGPLEGGKIVWSPGRNTTCPFEPIPAMSPSSKLILIALLMLSGLYLLRRSRTVEIG